MTSPLGNSFSGSPAIPTTPATLRYRDRRPASLLSPLGAITAGGLAATADPARLQGSFISATTAQVRVASLDPDGLEDAARTHGAFMSVSGLPAKAAAGAGATPSKGVAFSESPHPRTLTDSLDPAIFSRVLSRSFSGFSPGGLDPSPPYRTPTPSEPVTAFVASVLESDYQIVHLERGTYRVLNPKGECIALFKPSNEVRGGSASAHGSRVVMSKPGVPPYAEPLNEVIVADLFALPIFAVLTNLRGVFHGNDEPVEKEGVLIVFIPNAEPIPETRRDFPLDSFQLLALIDLMVCNADRNCTNALTQDGRVVGIDHATIAPANFEAPGIFFWRTYPQAFIPFSAEKVAFIRAKSFEVDREKVLHCFPDYPLESLATLRACYALVQHAVDRQLPPFAIASLLSQYSESTVSVMKALHEKSKNPDPEIAFTTLMRLTDRALDYLTTLPWTEFQERAKGDPLFVADLQKRILKDLNELDGKDFLRGPYSVIEEEE